MVWVVQIPYLAQNHRRFLLHSGWVFQKGTRDCDELPIPLLVTVCLALLSRPLYFNKGIRALKFLGVIAGTAMFGDVNSVYPISSRGSLIKPDLQLAAANMVRIRNVYS